MRRLGTVPALLLVLALCGCSPAARPDAPVPSPLAPVASTAFPTPGGDDPEPPDVQVFAPAYPGSERTDAKSMHMASADHKAWLHDVEELQTSDDLERVYQWYQQHMTVRFRQDQTDHGQRVIQMSDHASPSQRPAATEPETWVQLQRDSSINKTVITITSMRLEGATPGAR